MQTIKESAAKTQANRIEQQQLKMAQKISQWEIETREANKKALDIINKEWWLKNVKDVESLSENVDKSIEWYKKQQTELTRTDTNRYWQTDLWLEKPTEVLDSQWNKTTQNVMEYPVDKLLDNIIEHYEKTDKSTAFKYKILQKSIKKLKIVYGKLIRNKERVK